MPFSSSEPPPDDPIYAALGRAVSRWAGVEESLFDLFRELMGADESVSAIVFFSFRTLDNRLSLITEILGAYIRA